MSLKRFGLFCLIWTLGCAFIIEPAFISPLFEQQGTLELALNVHQSDVPQTALFTTRGSEVESMDHFRVLVLLYVVVPALVYLGTNLESL